MDHHRPVLFPVGAGIGQVEALGQVHVQLNGAALPGTANAVLQVEVDLGAVEGAVALVDHVVHAQLVQSALEAVGGLGPHLVGADGVFRPGGQLHVIFKAKYAVYLVDQVVHALDLVLDLLGGHEDVGVVLGEAAHPHEPVEGAGQLVAVYQAQLAAAAGQVPVAPGLALVDQNAAGAVHGLDGEILIVDAGGVHVVLVVIPMAGALPQGPGEDNGGLDLLIAVLPVNLTPVVLQQVAQHHALGEEEGEPGALVEDGEQVQLPAQAAVVPLLGLLQALEIGVQGFLVEEGGAVNALEHLVVLVAPPVGAGDAGELKGLHLAGGGQMGPGAQVGKVALAVEGDHRVLGQVLNQLHLVGLSRLFAEGQGLGAGQFKALQPLVALDDAGHLLFHLGQKLGSKGLLHVEVVIEAVLDGGADGQLGLGVQVQHRLGQHVAGGMAQGLAAVLVVKGEQLQNMVALNGLHQGDHLAVQLGGQGGFFHVAGQLARDVQGIHAILKMLYFAVNGEIHGHPPLNKKTAPMKGRTFCPRFHPTCFKPLAGLYRAPSAPRSGGGPRTSPAKRAFSQRRILSAAAAGTIFPRHSEANI